MLYFYRLLRNNSAGSEKYLFAFVRKNSPSAVTPTTTYWLSQTSGASTRAFVPGDIHLDALLELFIGFPMQARHPGGVSAGCYFKSCQSPVIAPVFQRPEQDIVESSTEEGKHAWVVSLPRERCSVKRENDDELRTCTSRIPRCSASLIRWVCPNFSRPTFPCENAFAIRLAFIWQSLYTQYTYYLKIYSLIFLFTHCALFVTKSHLENFFIIKIIFWCCVHSNKCYLAGENYFIYICETNKRNKRLRWRVNNDIILYVIIYLISLWINPRINLSSSRCLAQTHLYAILRMSGGMLEKVSGWFIILHVSAKLESR